MRMACGTNSTDLIRFSDPLYGAFKGGFLTDLQRPCTFKTGYVIPHQPAGLSAWQHLSDLGNWTGTGVIM